MINPKSNFITQTSEEKFSKANKYKMINKLFYIKITNKITKLKIIIISNVLLTIILFGEINKFNLIQEYYFYYHKISFFKFFFE